MRPLPRNNQIHGRHERLAQAAGSSDYLEQRLGLAISRARHGPDLAAFDVDAFLRVLDLRVELCDLVLEGCDPILLRSDLVREPLLAGGSSIERGAQLLLRRECPGKVGTQARAKLVVDVHLLARCPWTRPGGQWSWRPRRGSGRGCGSWRARGVDGSSVRQLERKDHAEDGDPGDYACHTRYRRKPNVAVRAPRIMPAMMTAATTYLIEVRPTPGSTCAYVAAA